MIRLILVVLSMGLSMPSEARERKASPDAPVQSREEAHKDLYEDVRRHIKEMPNTPYGKTPEGKRDIAYEAEIQPLFDKLFAGKIDEEAFEGARQALMRKHYGVKQQVNDPQYGRNEWLGPRAPVVDESSYPLPPPPIAPVLE